MKNVTTLADLKPGRNFLFAAIHWTLLDKTEEKALCLMLDQSGPIQFDEGAGSDYRAASLRTYLEGHFMKILLNNGARKIDFLPLQMDLSRDGEKNAIVMDAGIGLLSWRQLCKYQAIIPRSSESYGWFWTCTQSAGILGPGLIGSPCHLHPAFGYFQAHMDGLFIRPAICLRPDVFVTGV